MTDLSPEAQWKNESSDPLWEGDTREDKAFASPKRIARRKSAPRIVNEEQPYHHRGSTTSPVRARKTAKSSSKQRRRRDRIRPRHDDNDSITIASSKPDPQAFHASPEKPNGNTPLHQFVHPPTTPGRDSKSLRASLREGKRQLLEILNTKEGTAYSNLQKGFRRSASCGGGQYSDEGSTASTSGSHSSTFSSDGFASSKDNNNVDVATFQAAAIDSDQELEQYSRQIRLELRQAEMLELAREAERAAASGRKSFSGRASTFGDESSDLEPTADNNMNQKILPFSQRVVRRSMDFGTPLGRRLRRPPPSKISVVALRDVAEVVPSFKDFHLHLRTHFLRRRVDENVLMFEESEVPPSSQTATTSDRLKEPPGSRVGGEHNNMMHMWSSFNFGTWASSSNRGNTEAETKNDTVDVKRDPPAATDLSPSIDEDERGGDDPSADPSADSDVGDMLSGHMHARLQGSKGFRLSRVEVPPGLSLLDQETFSFQAEEATNDSAVAQGNSGRAEVESSPCTPKQTRPSEVGKLEVFSTESPPEGHRYLGRQHGLASGPIQDGSPHSPIIVDDIGLDRSLTPDPDSGESPPPGLPLTPKDNFRHVFETTFTTPKESRRQELMATRIAAASNSINEVIMLRPDFVTPVRLRDIRDDQILELAGLPHAPLIGGSYGKNSLLAETPTTIGTPNETLPRPRRTSWNSSERTRSNVNGPSQINGVRLEMRRSPRTHEYGALLHSSFDNAGDRPTTTLLDETFDMTSDFSDPGIDQSREQDYGGTLDTTFSQHEPRTLLPSRASNSDQYESPMRSRTREMPRGFHNSKKQHVDPDGEYLSRGEECDKSSQQRLLQSASMPAFKSERYSRSSLEHPTIAKGKSYDVHQTGGECTMEGAAQPIATRHRASSYGSAMMPASHLEGAKAASSRLRRLEDSLQVSQRAEVRHSHVGRVFESYKAGSANDIISVEAPESPNNDSILVIDFNGMDSAAKVRQGSIAGDSKQADHVSKATADFQCECLISPASSLDSEDGLREVKGSKNRATNDYSTWNLMDHSSMPPSDSNQPLQAAVAMFSSISPTSSRRPLDNVILAPSKENDAFVSNYLYCSKTAEVEIAPDPEPICSGSAPCQDANMPCGEIAVDTCVGDFLDNALKFLPKKSSGGSKHLSLSRHNTGELRKKPVSWYDVANEKFDLLLENFMGNEHRNGEHSRLSYEAPALKERKSPPRTLPRHDEVYDEDFGGVVYVPSGSHSDLDPSQSSQHSNEGRLLTEADTAEESGNTQPSRGRARGRHLQHSQSLTETAAYDSHLHSTQILRSKHTM